MESQSTLGAYSLQFRLPSGDTVQHILSPTTTIHQLKQTLASDALPAARMRLVRGGRVLRDDTQTLLDYDIVSGDIVYVVLSAGNETPAISSEALSRFDPNASTEDKGPFGMGGGDAFGDMLGSPIMKSLMSNSDFMRELFMNHPQMKKLAEENVEVAHMLRHPEFFDTLMAAQKPQIMREMMRNNDRALSNIEAMPGGFNHLLQMYKGIQEPMMEAERPANPSTEALNQAYAARYRVAPVNTERGPNAQALPNPWQAPTSSSSSSSMAASRMFGSGDPFAGFSQNSPFLFSPQSFSRPRVTSRREEASSSGASPRSAFIPPLAQRRSPPSGSSHRAHTTPATPATSTTTQQQQQQQQQHSSDDLVTAPTTITTTVPPASILPNLATAPAASSIPSLPTPSSTSSATSAARYPQQLAEMRDMGFTDDEQNSRALLLSGGDLNGAIELLLRSDPYAEANPHSG